MALSEADDRSQPPDVGERHQWSITTAWDEAGRGQGPSMTCARVEDRIAERTTELCPDFASVMVG